MNTIILCEGKSDAILLSYYLGRTQDWHFSKKEPVQIPVLSGQAKDAVNWYKRGDDSLAIWGVGGKDRFSEAIQTINELNHLGNPDQTITKLVILTDRDQAESDADKLGELEIGFKNSKMDITLRNNTWVDVKYTDSFGEEVRFQVLSLIIPFNKHGALETFLLDALSEDADDKLIVDAARNFVAGISSTKYLYKPRLRLKAELGSTLAIISPEKVFHDINTMLLSIPWERYHSIQTCFKRLNEI